MSEAKHRLERSAKNVAAYLHWRRQLDLLPVDTRVIEAIRRYSTDGRQGLRESQLRALVPEIGRRQRGAILRRLVFTKRIAVGSFGVDQEPLYIWRDI